MLLTQEHNVSIYNGNTGKSIISENFTESILGKILSISDSDLSLYIINIPNLLKNYKATFVISARQ